MKNYKVNVNGTDYVISIELMSDEEAAKAKSAAPASAPAAPAAAPAAAPGEGAEVAAPMQGTILSVNVSNGASVKQGDVLFILEAMKMENEIMAPCDGTVTSVCVSNGESVSNGTVLCTIK